MKFTVNDRAFTLTARHVAVAVVFLVFGVGIPRLISTFAMGDGLTDKLGDTEYTLLITSAVFGALVLTLGNAFLAHVLADRFTERDGLWYALAVAWTLDLLFAVVLIAPALMVGLQRGPLANILLVRVDWLPAGLMQWVWSIVAAVVFELLAAGSMAALAIVSRPAVNVSAITLPVVATPNTVDLQPLYDLLYSLTERLDAVNARLETLETRDVSLATRAPDMPTVFTVDEADPEQQALDMWTRDLKLSTRQVGEAVGVSHTQASKWRRQFEAQGLLPVVTKNGNGNGHKEA